MRVCIIPAGEGGVAFYRIIQPYSWLAENYGKEVFIFDKKVHDMSRLYHELAECDILIYQMPCGEQIVENIRRTKEKYGRKKMIVVEYDDNIFGAVSPWNTKYNVFGIENVQVTYSKPEDIETLRKHTKPEWAKENKDGSWTFKMWEDGYNDFFIENNIARLNAAKETVRIADLVTTTTPELAKVIRKYRTGKIAVLPNLIDFDRFLPMKKKNDGKIRIVWQGGSAHFHDLCMVAPELISFAKKHPEVEYVFQGVAYSAIFKEIQDRVSWLSWHGDIYTYPLSVRELSGDIAICPLTDDAFNRCKSPLKYCEMAAMKVPVVASPVVYSKYIEHGKDGYIARQGEWEACLEELMDEKKRNLVGECAYNRVKSRFGIQNSTMYWSALQDVMFGTNNSLNDKQDIVKYKPIVVPELAMNEMELNLN